MKNNHLQMDELACNIKNIGEVIFDILIEEDFSQDDYDKTLYKIESLAKAVGNNCKELEKECSKGLDIVEKQRIEMYQERKRASAVLAEA